MMEFLISKNLIKFFEMIEKFKLNITIKLNFLILEFNKYNFNLHCYLIRDPLGFIRDFA